MVDKETSTLLKGYMYPSAQVARCPRYHRCLISNKCQSYDAHQADCAVCETRVDPPGRLGGILPEGKYIPDLQDAISTIEKNLKVSFAHRDARMHKDPNSVEMTQKWDRLQKSVEMCKQFMAEGTWTSLDEKVMNAVYDTQQKKFLGRID